MRSIKKHQSDLLATMSFLFLMLTVVSCSNPSPDEFFQKTVLNSNMVNQFPPEIFGEYLEKSSVEHQGTKLKGDEAQSIVNTKIQWMEKLIADIKELSTTEETKEIKDLSIQLYELCLRAYQNEYSAYARLCDTHAPNEEKIALLKSIDGKYMPEYEELYGQLMMKGKVFAEENNLNVNWGQ